MQGRSPSATWTVSYELPSCFTDNWSSAKVLAWTLLDIPNARILPPSDGRIEDHDRRSWWQTAVDLLMFGKGWIDLAQELQRWRMNDYFANDSVLSFVRNTWGETIIALEWYLLLHPRANETISGHVTGIRRQSPNYGLAGEKVDIATSTELFNQLLKVRDHHPAFKLVDVLLGKNSGEKFTKHGATTSGTDSAHLASHFSLQAGNWSPTIESSDELMIAGRSAVLTVAKYEGWYHKIHDLRRESHDPESTLTDIEIREITVLVSGMGYLGNFVFDDDLSCFIRG
jgi:hypothetical protein